jgi:hypothetical protein
MIVILFPEKRGEKTMDAQQDSHKMELCLGKEFNRGNWKVRQIERRTLVKWKNIANFLGVSKRRAKELYKEEGLPVWMGSDPRKGASQGNIALASVDDILYWLTNKTSPHPPEYP